MKANQSHLAPMLLMTSQKWWRVCVVVMSTLVLGGCANFTEAISIRKSLDTDAPNAYSISAKQRVILSNPVTDTQGKKHVRLCAEPAPDVFSVLAASLSAEASAEQGVSQVGAAARLAGGFSEGASTIERSQTLNLLRETMYRTCERYMSGAIDYAEFIIQAARDQRMAVTVLAIEQLTGVVRGNATALTAIARASVDGHPVALLADAKKSHDAAKASLMDAAKGVVDNLDANDCQGKGQDSAADDAKKSKFNQACEDYKLAADHYGRVAKLSDANARASSELQAFAHMGDVLKSVGATDQNLLYTVKELVAMNDNFPEGLMLCVTKFRGRDGGEGLAEEIKKTCMDLLNKQLTKEKELADKAAADASLVTAQLNNSKTQIQARTVIERSQLEGPWGVVFGGDKTVLAAQDEMKNAAKWQLTDPRIYFRDGVYRSVSVSTNSTEAQAMLRLAIANVPKRQPYLVNLATWCLEPTHTQQAGVNITSCK